MEDASLDEFLDDTPGDGEVVDDDRIDTDADGMSGVPDDTATETPSKGDGTATDSTPEQEDTAATVKSLDPPTGVWRPGAECAECGTGCNRLWNDEGRLVCPECKDWG